MDQNTLIQIALVIVLMPVLILQLAMGVLFLIKLGDLIPALICDLITCIFRIFNRNRVSLCKAREERNEIDSDGI